MKIKYYLKRMIPDKIYLKFRFKRVMNKKLDLRNPQTFNEKLQWLKLYDRQKVYTTMVDKYQAKKYVEEIIGEKYIIPTLGVYDKFEDINFDDLPNKFVIKCTHDSGGTIICKNKNELNIKTIGKKINESLKRNFFWEYREWPYKNVKPKIIIEKFMQNENDESLNDYKIFCFNGKPYMILVCSNRVENHKDTDFFDCNWNKINLSRKNSKNSKQKISKPNNLEEMLNLARLLSKNTIFLRVDLYDINNKVYFGELTFYPSSGFEGFEPDNWDRKLGDMLILPKKN